MYFLNSAAARSEVSNVSKGATRERMNLGAVSRIRIPVPALARQSEIVAFLDRETVEADALVAKYERLIELLEEKRIALITRAVTKGLDAAAPTKDSGIEWLGEVPAHWNISPLKYLVEVTSGSTPSKDRPEYWNGNLPWASAKDLKSDSIADTEDHVSDLAAAECGLKVIPTSSILLVVRGMILARYLPVTITEQPMTINQDLKALRVREHVDVLYLANFLRSKSSTIIALADTAAHGTKVLRSEDWLNLPVPVPPKGEQIAIIARTVGESSSLNNAKAKVSDAITLAKEHRSALITAAVTGQIDVTKYRSKKHSAVEIPA